MKNLIILTVMSLLTLTACNDNKTSAHSKGDAISRKCNKKYRTLPDYARCRCRLLTRSKSWTKEMDDCMTDRARYAKFFEGKASK
mgnify:CR=1 FL=1